MERVELGAVGYLTWNDPTLTLVGQSRNRLSIALHKTFKSVPYDSSEIQTHNLAHRYKQILKRWRISASGRQVDPNLVSFGAKNGGGGGGFTRPIPRDGGADQFRGIPIVGRLPTDGTRGPEKKGCGRKWPDAEGLVQGSRARDVRDPVVQNHSCCKKESRLDQPCGDKS